MAKDRSKGHGTMKGSLHDPASAVTHAASDPPPSASAQPAQPSVADESGASRAEAAAVVRREKRVVRSRTEHQQNARIARADAFDPSTGDRVQRRRKKLKGKVYAAELVHLQIELVKLQEWIKARGLKVVCLFEGRDAAGKGGVIKRITESLNPRVARICALGIPTDRDKTQWYFQRYVAEFPAAGEWVLFDRSWYNRAGVEHVMDFCTQEEYKDFLKTAPEFERMLVRSGIILIKYWFSVSDEEQERRFQDRIDQPTKRWKISPMDVTARSKWVDYSRAKDAMFAATNTAEAPWWVVEADDKKRARLNCISHLLGMIPYEDTTPDQIVLPPRQVDKGYKRPPIRKQHFVPEKY